MPLTLFDGTTTITLPDSLEWVDEYEWSDVKQDVQPTIGGSLVVSENLVTAGRPITLVSGAEVWVLKSVLDNLMTLVNTVDKTYTLTLPDDRTFTVMFDRRQGEAVTANPVWRKNVQEDTDYYTITLRMMVV